MRGRQKAALASPTMKQYLVADLHQQWLESGKQPVVLFSSSVPFESPEIIPVAPTVEPLAVSALPIAPPIEPLIPVEVPVFVAPVDREPTVVVEPEPPLWQKIMSALNAALDSIPPLQFPKLTLPTYQLPSLPPRPQISRPELPSFQLPSATLPQFPQLPTLVVPTAADFKYWVSSRVAPAREKLSNLPWPQILKIGSNVAYGAAIAVFAMFLIPIILLEGHSKLRQWQSQMAEVRLFSQKPTPPPTPTPTPEPQINTVDDFFSVEIPRLKIASRIIPNVSTSDAKQYESALKLGVAHAEGTGLPDDTSENKTIYLFAHSTNATFNIQRYNAQFYALKDTAAGDQIKVRYWGQDYWFTIQETKIVDANDTSYLQPQTDEVRLILQTCYPPGTTWKRLVVIATPTPEGDTSRAGVEKVTP
jgi:LPXTG-site transpeptidase (sortase) family protein